MSEENKIITLSPQQISSILGDCRHDKQKGGYLEDPKCLICDDPISHEWLDGNYELLICPKKSCWEKFLPRDLAKKFFAHKTRYQHMKTEPKKEPSESETKMTGGRYKIAKELCTDSTTNNTQQ